jgi:lipopolysaccharide export system protein LptC
VNIPTSRIQAALTIALATTIALGSFWLRQVMLDSAEAPERIPAPNEPDYNVEHFTFVRLSESGRLHYRIAGEKLTHFLNDTFEVTHPVMHAVSEGPSYMNARSERAVIDNPARKIHMYDNVQLDRPPTAGSRDFRVRSEYLMILPDDDIVRTDKPVDIQSGRSRLTGVGMFANNRTQEFQLLNQVHGIFFPAQH